MFRVSLANLAVGATFSGSTAAAGYPAFNAGSPERPFQPWKTTATGAQRLVVSFGAPVTLDHVTLIRTGFASAIIQGNATDEWESPPPSYSQEVTVARNSVSSRYHHAHQIVGSFTYPYLSILIPSQTPLDGAASYLLGGVWAGVWTYPPRAFRWGYRLERIEPLLDQRTLSGGLHRLRLGEPIARITAQRQALLGATAPGLTDDLAAWWELDRKMAEADVTLVWWEPGDPAQVWVMRRLAPPDWTVTGPRLAEASLELEEILAGGGQS